MIHKKLVRIMTFSNYRELSKHLFASLENMNMINELDKYFVALFMYSFFNNKLPSNFESYFTTNDVIHSHNKRSASKLHIDYQRTNYGKSSITYKGPDTWNSLPENLENKGSYRLFKSYLKSYRHNT